MGGRDCCAPLAPGTAAADGKPARSVPAPVRGRCGAAPAPACGQDLAPRAPTGERTDPALRRDLPDYSYMAKFLAELLGCTLPSKGASPMLEVGGGGCVPQPRLSAVAAAPRPRPGVPRSWPVQSHFVCFPPGCLGRGRDRMAR